MSETDQRELCAKVGAEYSPPVDGSRLGLARGSLKHLPLHGLRLAPEAGTCGWYLWWGEWSEAPDFFEPVCVEHLPSCCPMALPFLALPPGWRFLTDGSYSDVWQDPGLLEVGSRGS